jgi:hypothetical protein
VFCDVYLDGTTRINPKFPPIYETYSERSVVSLELKNSPDGSHFMREFPHQSGTVERDTAKSIQCRVTLFISEILRPFYLVALKMSAICNPKG